MSAVLSAGAGITQMARTSLNKTFDFVKQNPIKAATAVALIAIKFYWDFQSAATACNKNFIFSPDNCSVELCQNNICQPVDPCSPTIAYLAQLFLPARCLPCA